MDQKRLSLSPKNQNQMFNKFERIPAYSKKTSSYLTKFLQKEKASRNYTGRALTIEYPLTPKGDISEDYRLNNKRPSDQIHSLEVGSLVSNRTTVNNA